jgi:hypothetical protein
MVCVARCSTLSEVSKIVLRTVLCIQSILCIKNNKIVSEKCRSVEVDQLEYHNRVKYIVIVSNVHKSTIMRI